MQLHSFLEYHAAAKPNAEFAADGERRLTYAEALSKVNRFANALAASGLAPGDRFSFLGRNSIEYSLLYFAGSRCGAVPVPLNYRLAAAEWEYIIKDSESRVIIADTEYCEAIESIRHNLPLVNETIAIGTDARTGWKAFSSWTEAQPTTPPSFGSGDTRDVLQMYTSGTTGRPKGVVLTDENILANVMQLAPLCRDQWRGRVLVAAPLYHAAAAYLCWGTVFWGESMFIQRDFVPADVVSALSGENIGFALLVPAMIQACLMMVPDVAERDYESLRGICYGASPISETTLRRAMEVFGCDFVQAYGMTEASPVLTCLSAQDHRRAITEDPRLLASAGRGIVGTEIRIVDADDNDVPRGALGEIIVRGKQVMKEYWKQPEATSKALKGGWLHTGDAGTMDEQGFIFIQDRVKDMIVSGGENIYPREIEEVLFEHPLVADAAVIGVPDAKWGESVKAIIVVQGDSAPAKDEVIAFCRGKLGSYKVPRSVDYVQDLPRNPSGKVLKRELRKLYWEGEERGIAGS